MLKMQVSTQTISFPSIAFNANIASVNNFDTIVKDKISFTKLPSTKAEVATLKPLAVFDKAKEVEAIVVAADALAVEHNNYEQQYVEGGRKALYAVLAKIYALALQVNISDYSDSILKELRNKLSLRGVRMQKNSNAIALIARLVVGVNRQTAHNYSVALQAAFNDNIAAADLSDYLTKRGGMQAAKSVVKKQIATENDKKYEEFKLFMRNADVHHAAYKNTHIEWKNKVFGLEYSDNMIIMGISEGGGKMQGYRAFYISNEAQAKINRIISDEWFKNVSAEEVAKGIEKESDQAFKLHLENLSKKT